MQVRLVGAVSFAGVSHTQHADNVGQSRGHAGHKSQW